MDSKEVEKLERKKKKSSADALLCGRAVHDNSVVESFPENTNKASVERHANLWGDGGMRMTETGTLNNTRLTAQGRLLQGYKTSEEMSRKVITFSFSFNEMISLWMEEYKTEEKKKE